MCVGSISKYCTKKYGIILMFYTFNHSSVSHEQLVTDWALEVGFLGKKEVR